MKKWFVVWAFTTLSLMADYTAQPIDQPLIDSKMKIIDIRTPTEWNDGTGQRVDPHYVFR